MVIGQVVKTIRVNVVMMGLIGMGNNPMVGATVAVAVAIYLFSTI